MLPGSPSQRSTASISFQERVRGLSEEVQIHGHVVTLQGVGHSLALAQGKAGWHGFMVCAEQAPTLGPDNTPPLIRGQGLRGACLRIKGKFSRNGEEAENKSRCSSTAAASTIGKNLWRGEGNA